MKQKNSRIEKDPKENELEIAKNLVKKVKTFLADYNFDRFNSIESRDREYSKKGVIDSHFERIKEEEYSPYVYAMLFGRGDFSHITEEEINEDIKSKVNPKLIKTKLALTARRIILEIEEGLAKYSKVSERADNVGNWESLEGFLELHESISNRVKTLRVIYEKMKPNTSILDLEYSFSDYTYGETRTKHYFGRLAEKLLNFLKNAGLYESDLCFRGFNPKRLSKLLKTGNDRYKTEKGIIYASIEGEGNEDVWKMPPGKNRWILESAIDRAIQKRRRGLISKILGNEGQFTISVYKGKDLQIDSPYLGRYILKQNKKPIAVIRFSKSKKKVS